MINIDSSKAPEGATHFSFGDKSAGRRDAWWRPHPKLVGKYLCWAIGFGICCNEWQELSFDLPRNAVRIPCNGDSLPPIGSHVVVRDDGTLVYGQGESGEVLAHVDGCAVIRMSYGLGCFLPRVLRTQESIAAEERKQAVQDMFDIFHKAPGLSAIEGLDALYLAGYRKQADPCKP